MTSWIFECKCVRVLGFLYVPKISRKIFKHCHRNLNVSECVFVCLCGGCMSVSDCVYVCVSEWVCLSVCVSLTHPFKQYHRT